MKIAVRLLQIIALAASAAWAGPPVADWIDREIAIRRARCAWQEILRGNGAAIEGREVDPEFWLTIPSVGIDLPVITAESEAQLKRHVGCVRKGSFTVISGHRDLHFRPLRNLREGAAIQLEETDGTLHTFRVNRTEIFDADELASRIEAVEKPGRLALVTCYPFYYVGDAPQRIVALASHLDRKVR